MSTLRTLLFAISLSLLSPFLFIPFLFLTPSSPTTPTALHRPPTTDHIIAEESCSGRSLYDPAHSIASQGVTTYTTQGNYHHHNPNPTFDFAFAAGLFHFAAAAVPPGCSGNPAAGAGALTFDPNDSPNEASAGLLVSLSTCTYTTLKFSSAVANVPIFNVGLTIADVKATTVSFEASLVFGKGSSVSITRLNSGAVTFSAGLSSAVLDASHLTLTAGLFFTGITAGVLDSTISLSFLDINAGASDALRVTATTLQNSAFRLSKSILRSTSGKAMQWSLAPIYPRLADGETEKCEVSIAGNTFSAPNGLLFETQTDWSRWANVRQTITGNIFKTTTTALQVFVGYPLLFSSDGNSVEGGKVSVKILRDTLRFKFHLKNSVVTSLVYDYANQLNTSTGDEIRFDNVTFTATGSSLKLPTSSNATVAFSNCRSTAAGVSPIVTFRALNVGRLTYDKCNFAGALSVATTFVSYRFDLAIRSTRVTTCAALKFFQLYHSNVTVSDNSTLGCFSVEGNSTGNAFRLRNSTLIAHGTAATKVPATLDFLNDWYDSSLDIDGCFLGTGVSTTRIVLFSGLQERTKHSFTRNTIAHTTTTAGTGILPASCVFGYSRKKNMKAYPPIKEGSSAFFSGNIATINTKDTYLLYANVAGGELTFDETNSAKPTVAAASGRFYVNMLTTSNDAIAISLQNIRNFNKCEIVRYQAISASHYEMISIKDSSFQSLSVYVHTAVGLNLTVDNVVAVTSLNFQAVSIGSSTLVFKNITVPMLYQSIQSMRTSNLVTQSCSTGGIQHFVSSFAGSTLRILNNRVNGKNLRMRGGLFESQALIQNNTIWGSAIGIHLDSYSVAVGRLDLVNNTLTTPSFVGIRFERSICLAGSDVTFVGNIVSNCVSSLYSNDDHRAGCTFRFTGNQFSTTSNTASGVNGFVMHLVLAGARVVHDRTNRHSFGAIKIYHTMPSFGNLFVLGTYGLYTQSLAVFEWIYKNSLHTSVKDTIQMGNVTFARALRIQFPNATETYVRLRHVGATALQVHHRVALNSTVLLENCTSTGTHITLSTTSGCTTCRFEIQGSTAKTYIQLAGRATANTTFHVWRSRMPFFVSATAYSSFSGLRLFENILAGSTSRSATVDLTVGGWSSDSYLEIDSCDITAASRAIAISQHSAGRVLHKITNNVMRVTGTSALNFAPYSGCITYTRSVKVAPLQAASIGLDTLLLIRNNSFTVQTINTYVLFVTTRDNGRVVMDNANRIYSRTPTVAAGRIYIYSTGTDEKRGQGHKIVIADIPKLYSFNIARRVGTISYNEQFELHNVSVSFASVYTQTSHNLKVYFSNIAMVGDCTIYGTAAQAASVTYRGVRTRSLYQQITTLTSSSLDLIDNTVTGRIYHSAMSRDGTIVTIQGNTIVDSTTSPIEVRGAVLDSQLFVERNRAVVSSKFALYFNGYTVRNARVTVAHNSLRSSLNTAISWVNSPVYLCADVYFLNNSLSGAAGVFNMFGKDVGAGGTMWFRYNEFIASTDSRDALRLTLGAGGRMDFDGTNIVRNGVVRVYNDYHTSRNNVFMISNASRPYRFEWVYRAANGTSANDTIVLSGVTVTTYVLLDIPGIHDSHINISNARIGSYTTLRMKKANNVEIAIEGAIIGTYVSVVPLSGVSVFQNVSMGLRNSVVGSRIDVSAEFYASTFFFRNVSCNAQISMRGRYSQRSTLLMEEVVMASTSNAPIYMQPIFEDSSLIVDRCRITTTSFKGFLINQNTKGSATHMITNSYFYAGSLDTAAYIENPPRYCALCYTRLSTYPAVTGR